MAGLPSSLDTGDKKAAVGETGPGANISAIARKYKLRPDRLFSWCRLVHEGALSAVPARGDA